MSCYFTGLLNATGPILAGFWGLTLTEVVTPATTDSENFGLCPKGFYCPEQSPYPIPCPAGTYGYIHVMTLLRIFLDT